MKRCEVLYTIVVRCLEGLDELYQGVNGVERAGAGSTVIARIWVC